MDTRELTAPTRGPDSAPPAASTFESRAGIEQPAPIRPGVSRARNAGIGRGGWGFRGRVLANAVVLAMSLILPMQAQAFTFADRDTEIGITSLDQLGGITNDALLDSLERTAFLFFWNEVNPANGLIKDRSTPGSPCSIASVGFGLSAICIGVERGWIDRAAARSRVLTTLQTFWNGPQGSGASGFIGYKGLFYHFLDMNTATRTWSCEVSTIDSALLFAGILDAKQFFNENESSENEIRSLAESIVHRADWNFFRNFNPGVLMGWKPGTGFSGFGQWIGYNEAMILYVLALGSPTFPIPATAWNTWTSGYNWQTQYGQTYVIFPPLFGHQYSHCWIDFRYIQDAYMRNKGITYFENSRRATLAQRQYCTVNPFAFQGYGANHWGITAGDGPTGYNARGAPPAQNDNGTITPTAVASSLPFAPDEVVACLQNIYATYRDELWGPYGFRDGFNESVDWFATDYIGIDQGPIVMMIENYRTGSTWNRILQDPDIQAGLIQAGFQVATDVELPVAGAPTILYPVAPNPLRETAMIRFDLPKSGHTRLALHDATGRTVRSIFDGYQDAGTHQVELDSRGLPAGVYFYVLNNGTEVHERRCVVVR